MSKNYYKILGVERNSTTDQIKKAYRKLAMKWHPDRNPSNKQEAESKFKEIGEAYSVLVDDKKRKQYDQFGADGLKNSFSGSHFTFSNAEDIFKSFFGDETPFNSFGGMFGSTDFRMGGMNGSSMPNFSNLGGFNFESSQAKKGKIVSHKFYLSLEEIYNGTSKQMKVNRKRLNADGRTTRQETKILKINVKPGWKAGTKITFEREGDELPGIIPADIQFIVGEKPHNRFERSGNDLIYKEIITLKQALIGDFIIKIQTLNNRYLQIPINKIIYPGYIHKINNEGMPISKTNGKQKGNLLIQFEIKFPKQLNEKQKNLIKQCL